MTTMTARSPSAFALSATLHAAVVVLVLGGLWLEQSSRPSRPVVFELVAGEGNDFTATQAPEGNSQGARLPVIRPPEPTPPNPRADEPPAHSDPTPAPTPQRQTPSRPNPTPAPKATKPTTAPQRITEQQFKQQNPGRANNTSRQTNSPAPAQRGGTGPRINPSEVLGVRGSQSRSGAGGTALTAQQLDARNAYLADLFRQLREVHQKPAGLSDLLETLVEFRINPNGSVGNVQIVQSSGNSAFDQSVLAAFRRITLSAPPDGRVLTDRVLFKMSDTR
jgi:colicin import membrane protein